MNISPTVTITADKFDLGRLAALAEVSKTKATFVSEDEVLDGLVKTFMTARSNRPIAIDYDDFLVYGRCLTEVNKERNLTGTTDHRDRVAINNVLNMYSRFDF